MKAQIIPYPSPPREVVVTMGEEEARTVYHAVLNIHRGFGLSALQASSIASLRDALQNAGIQ